MTVIEVQALTSVRTYLPQIAKELKRIADSLEVVACDEIPSRISIGGKTFNVAYKPQTKKENDNGNA